MRCDAGRSPCAALWGGGVRAFPRTGVPAVVCVSLDDYREPLYIGWQRFGVAISVRDRYTALNVLPGGCPGRRYRGNCACCKAFPCAGSSSVPQGLSGGTSYFALAFLRTSIEVRQPEASGCEGLHDSSVPHCSFSRLRAEKTCQVCNAIYRQEGIPTMTGVRSALPVGRFPLRFIVTKPMAYFAAVTIGSLRVGYFPMVVLSFGYFSMPVSR